MAAIQNHAIMDCGNGKVIQFHPSICLSSTPAHVLTHTSGSYATLATIPFFSLFLVTHLAGVCLWRSPTAMSRRAGIRTAHPVAPPPGP